VAAITIYKPQSAAISRWTLGISAMALATYGCYHLYLFVPERWRAPFGGPGGWGAALGEEFPISIALVLSVVLGIAGAIGTFLAVNYPRFVDFLSDTEVEMTKVSWSSRKEVLGSSAVVIATVVILGFWIGLVDILLLVVPKWIGKLFS